MKPKDLKREEAAQTPQWDSKKTRESLNNLFDDFVVKAISSSIEWYFQKRTQKKRVGFAIRIGAIAVGGAGALIPIVVDLLSDPTKSPLIRPAWASVALLLGAGLAWADRFLGATSGWIRYINAGLQLTCLRDIAVLRWRQLEATWGDEEPDAQKIASAIDLLQELNGQAHAVVQEETKAWIVEFQRSLDQLDAMLQTRAAEAEVAAEAARRKQPQVGSIVATISKGDETDAKVIVECVSTLRGAARMTREVIGSKAIFTNVAIGHWIVEATGTITKDGKSRKVSEASVAVVKLDEITNVDIKLS